MRKTNLRSTIWSLLVVLSLASYTYLNCFTADLKEDHATSNTDKGMEEERDAKVFLPDIAMVKTLLNITKIVMPKD